jgi:magnesium chelatase family protein
LHAGSIARYRSRVSGPLLDRIDIAIEVPSLPSEALRSARMPEKRSRITSDERRYPRRRRQRAPAADCASGQAERAIVVARNRGELTPGADGAALLAQAMARLSLSARAYHRILKVARTIADMAASDAIGAAHVAEERSPTRFDRCSAVGSGFGRIQWRNIASHQ